MKGEFGLGLDSSFLAVSSNRPTPNTGREYDAAGAELIRQLADFLALIKDGLVCFVGEGNLVSCVLSKPEELGTLPPHEEAGRWDGGMGGDGWLLDYVRESLHVATRQLKLKPIAFQGYGAHVELELSTSGRSTT